MMIAWLLFSVGSLLAATGMTLVVGAVAVSRVELYRWISHGLVTGPGGAVLSVPTRINGVANGIAGVGIILAAFGVMALVGPLPLWLGAATVFLIAIPFLLVVVYAIPRALGRRWAEPIVKGALPWLHRLATLLTPLVPSGGDAEPEAALARFLEADEDAVETGELVAVLLGVLNFTERPLREIMTPRTNIVAVREGAPLEEVGQIFAESGYSRVPVYRESLDNIIGMIYALDLLKVAPGAELPLRPVTVAPASKHCADLLFEMQRDRRHFAVVLDEFGGTAGIATFQDLLEELVGEIFPEPNGRGPESGGALEVVEATGATPCEEIAARFQVSFPSKAETVGGLLARSAGRIPLAGERFVVGALEFDVLAATPTRVDRVVVRRSPVPILHLGPSP